MDRIPRDRAGYHIRFKYLRNGIIYRGTDAEIDALLDTTKPQPWRVAPPRNTLPRVNTGVDQASDQAIEARNGIQNGVIPWATRSVQHDIPDDQRQRAKALVNQISRNLYDLVRPPPLPKWIPRPLQKKLRGDHVLGLPIRPNPRLGRARYRSPLLLADSQQPRAQTRRQDAARGRRLDAHREREGPDQGKSVHIRPGQA